ncbi:caspase family protein [Amycolatopsis sp. NPDC005003]
MSPRAEPPDYGRSRAVLIATARYQDDAYPQLPAARNSARGIRDLLTTAELCGWPGDRVTLIENPVGVVDLAKLLLRLSRETEDVLLLYYVGHGTITPSGELCLTLSDTEADLADITGLEYRRVKQALLESPARVKVSIIDCCYSGRAIETLSGVSATAADSTDTRGVYTMTASDHTAHVVPLAEQEFAWTSFTGELIDLVRAGVPGAPEELTLGRMYVELRRRLASRGLPRPNQRGTDTADLFAFARNVHVLGRYVREPWRASTVLTYADHPSRSPRFVEYRRATADIDLLPVNDGLRVEAVSCGDGPQRKVFPRERLRTLPAAFLLGEAMAGSDLEVNEFLLTRPDLFDPVEIEELVRSGGVLPDSAEVFAFPHEMVVSGVRDEPRHRIAVYLITDVAYLQGLDSADSAAFSVLCLLDNGGIVPFVAEEPGTGRFLVRSRHGTAGLVVAVAYDGTTAVARSRYTAVLRMGIRHQDDLWADGRTGQPFLAARPGEEPRFAFQSKQPNGLGRDVFVADLDGERMIDLTFKDHDGFSGLASGGREDSVGWLDARRIRYFTMRRGRIQLEEADDRI